MVRLIYPEGSYLFKRWLLPLATIRVIVKSATVLLPAALTRLGGVRAFNAIAGPGEGLLESLGVTAFFRAVAVYGIVAKVQTSVPLRRVRNR